MNKEKNTNGNVFGKIFAYTMLLLLLMSLGTVLLFARQFLTFYREEQQRQLSASFQPLIAVLADRDSTPDDITEAARTFASRNQSFNFAIQEGSGRVMFSTTDFMEGLPENAGQHLRLQYRAGIVNQREGSDGEFVFTGYGLGSELVQYGDLLRRSFLALGLMILIASLGAVLFTKKVTKPLEDEIIRERTMEENQRLFFSAASHELKTPIAAARAIVEGMLAGVGDYKDHRKYLRQCLNTLDSQARLVTEILEIVKLREESNLNMESLDLREIGENVLDEYRHLAEQLCLKILGEFPAVMIKSDRHLLQRVLSNLLANAIQNTPEGGTVIISAEKKKCLKLGILNTGTTIPPALIEKLFEPFYRTDAARTRNANLRHGAQSGLGLAIVKRALDRMSVPFSLENSPDGVLFHMELELAGESAVKHNFRKTTGNIQ